jgi:hypothetical protein
MGIRRFGLRAIIPQRSRRIALAVGVMAALAGCSSGSSRSTPAQDAGRADADADSASRDSQPDSRADLEPEAQRSADLAPDATRGQDTNLADAAGSKPETAEVGPDAGRSPDVGNEASQGADARADVDPRKDAGADAGSTDVVSVSRDADAQVTSDARTQDQGSSPGPDADPCGGGTTYPDSTTAKATITDYGWVRLGAASSPIVEFTTTMSVPETPAASGTLFLWPGLQPLRGGANYAALDNGVLQPVLTWGPTCAPNSPAQSYKSWWISGQYVNTYITSSSPNYASYDGCHGGPGMTVAVGDTLDMRFVLNGTDWTQTVTNRRTSQSVLYTLDMLGQAQASAEFVIEEYSSKPVSDVVFTSTVITFASSAKSVCQPAQRGKNDYFSAPRVSADGLRCCIDKVILRAEGVPATSSSVSSPLPASRREE